MRIGDLLHWGALLFAVSAFSWALTEASGAAASLALVAGLAAGIVALIGGLRTANNARHWILTGAVIALIAHVVFIMAFIGASPVNFKGDPGQSGVNQEPPAVFTWLSEQAGAWVPGLVLVAAVVAFWPTWHVRERILGTAGLALVVLTQALTLAGVGENSDGAATAYSGMFLVGFLASAAACGLPLFIEKNWPKREPAS